MGKIPLKSCTFFSLETSLPHAPCIGGPVLGVLVAAFDQPDTEQCQGLGDKQIIKAKKLKDF